MNIRKLCYELYKLDWKRSHMITREIEMDSLKDYYENLVDENYTYEDYIEEFGYDGELYACYEEFLEVEYLERGYIHSLLDNVDLEKEYELDVESEE